jgi:hypothetical protein
MYANVDNLMFNGTIQMFIEVTAPTNVILVHIKSKSGDKSDAYKNGNK